MPQSLAKVLLHIVYSTKNRTPWLQDKGVREEPHRYMGGILNAIDCPSLIVGGVEDHVHILCSLSRNLAIKSVIEQVKVEPSKWIKKQGARYADFHWQNGYGVFSVSPSKAGDVKEYIFHQEEHHRRASFQDEFRLLCKRHGVEMDERYVWD